MAVIHTDGNMVCAYEPQDGDAWVETLVDGGDGQRRCIARDPIEQYQAAVDAAVAMASQFSRAIHVVPICPSDLTQFFGPRLENGLATMTPEQRWQLRLDVVTTCAEVMRDCPDPQVRAEAHAVLVQMKVIRP